MVVNIYADGALLYSSGLPETSYVIQPRLKLEIGKVGSLEFTLLPTHRMYDTLREMVTIITAFIDDEMIYRGRVKTIKKDFYKQAKVMCEGDLGFLFDTIIGPATVKNKTPKEMFGYLINEHNKLITNAWESYKKFVVGNITVPGTDTKTEFEFSSDSTISDAIDSSLLDYYGGILSTRTENGVTYIDWLKYPEATDDDVPRIRFEVNLIDLEEEYPTDDIFTVLKPVGDDKLTIDGLYLYDTEAIERFGTIYKSLTFDGITSASKLKTAGQEYMRTHCRIYPNDLTVKAIDLHYLDSSKQQIKMGDFVHVISEPHGIDRIDCCKSIDYDFQNLENNTYLIGSFIPPDPKGKSSRKKTSGRGGGGGRKASGGGISGKSVASEDEIQAQINEVRDVSLQAKTLSIDAQNMVVNVEKQLNVYAKTANLKAEILNVLSKEVSVTTDSFSINTSSGPKSLSVEGLVSRITQLEAGFTSIKSTLAVKNNITCGGNVYANKFYVRESSSETNSVVATQAWVKDQLPQMSDYLKSSSFTNVSVRRKLGVGDNATFKAKYATVKLSSGASVTLHYWGTTSSGY